MIGAVEAGGTKFVLAVAHMDGTIVDRARMDSRTASSSAPGARCSARSFTRVSPERRT